MAHIDTSKHLDAPWWRRNLVALVIAALAITALLIWHFRPAPEGAAATGGADKSAKGQSKAGKGGASKFGGGDPNRPQPVSAVAAKSGDLNVVQTALGTVAALRTATVKTRADGLLQMILFKEGETVKEGAVLARIDPAPYQVALEQAEGQLARDAATLANAKVDLDRYQKLLSQDSIASQQVDQQVAMVKQLEGTVKLDQAGVDNAKLQLSWTNITAPIGGLVGLRQVDQGNMVHGSDANGIVSITQLDPITVLFTIPQDTLPRILARLRSGDKPSVEAWDREQKNLLAKGTLATTDNQIDVSTGTVRLRAQFDNSAGKLFPNQFVNVKMVVDTLHNVIMVPTAAVQRATQGTILYVVNDDNTVTVRPVKLGASEGEMTAVDSGVKAGERVVTDGVDRIREGAKVDVIVPGAPAHAGGDASKRTPEQREAFKKKLESMTPEQREAFKKQREAAKSGS
jgi:membrane fusion protein, multidrug efflux system